MLIMKRRQFIAIAASIGAGSLSGCIDNRKRDTTNQTTPKQTPDINPPDRPIRIDETVPTQYGSIRVTDFRAQQSIEIMGTVHRRVRNDREKQYLLFNFYVGNANGSPSELAETLREVLSLEIGVRSLNPMPYESARTIDNEDEATIIFEVDRPLSNLETINLSYNTDEYQYDWSVQELSRTTGYEIYLENPPEFEVIDVTVLSDRSSSDSVPVSVTVEEVSGNQFGTREEFNIKVGSTALTSSPVYKFTLSQGESVTREFEVNLFRTSGTEDIRVDWGRDSVSKEYQH